MLRQIIKIEEELCNGCGLCADACHEGAIAIVNGKAKLLRDDYCDGLGNCLPVCPTGAISFETREAAAFDEAAVADKVAAAQLKAATSCASQASVGGGCPGSASRTMSRQASSPSYALNQRYEVQEDSELRQWPVQIKLAPVNASFFNGAKLLVAADCSAYAYAQFHRDFIKDHVCLIGCPKLDEGDYSEKLTAILKSNDIKSVSVVRMEVPCCGGLEYAVKNALSQCGKMIPWHVTTISSDGRILEAY